MARRLQAARLPEGYARPFAVQEKPNYLGRNGGTIFLTSMLPYILTLSAITGAIYAALDQVAGEKSVVRSKPCLSRPPHAATSCSASSAPSGSPSALSAASSPSPASAWRLACIPRALTSWRREGCTSAQRPSGSACRHGAALAFAGLLLAVSTFARNQKEAQTYLAPIMMIVFVPMMASSPRDRCLPRNGRRSYSGASIIIKQALSGSFNVAFILIAFAASAVYAGLALTFATKLFQRESVLIKA